MRLLWMIALVTILIHSESLSAQTPVTEMEFLPLDEIGSRATTEEGPSGEPAIAVSGDDSPSITPLAIAVSPSISTPDYVVRGQVKIEGVVGDGYLELLSNFGPKGEFFSRTLSTWGSTRKLNGSSGWREFELPFHATAGMKPERLTLRVILQGRGKVAIARPLIVTSPVSAVQWWTNPQSGLVGGAIGSFLGILGGLIGLAVWKKSNRMAINVCAIAILFSLIALISGLAAACLGQPFHVFYPLLLVGGIGLTTIGFNSRNLLRRIQDDELNKIRAADSL